MRRFSLCEHLQIQPELLLDSEQSPVELAIKQVAGTFGAVRRLYACVSFLKVKKKAELPDDYFVLTLGLAAPLDFDRVAAKTEPLIAEAIARGFGDNQGYGVVRLQAHVPLIQYGESRSPSIAMSPLSKDDSCRFEQAVGE